MDVDEPVEDPLEDEPDEDDAEDDEDDDVEEVEEDELVESLPSFLAADPFVLDSLPGDSDPLRESVR